MYKLDFKQEKWPTIFCALLKGCAVITDNKSIKSQEQLTDKLSSLS